MPSRIAPHPDDAPGQMMQVSVPVGKMGGQVMQVNTPRGMMEVAIPQGLRAGQTFRFQLPDEHTKIVSSAPGPVPASAQLPVQVSMSNVPAQMMQVSVPVGKMGGQVMQVNTPRGMMEVAIPQGLRAGQTFQFQLPDEHGPVPASAQLPVPASAQLPVQVSMSNVPAQIASSNPGQVKPRPLYAQLPVQESMQTQTMQKPDCCESFCLGEDAMTNARVHPLIDSLQAGLRIYSQSFWGDAWLTFKNSHVVVSCFTVHPKHYFDARERCGVLVTSLMVAFGLNASLESSGDGGGGGTVLLGAYAMALQFSYDYFAKESVSCSCVQRSQNYVKDCFECIGKYAFFYLAAIALSLFVSGITAVTIMGGSVSIALLTFVGSTMGNFIFSSSLWHLVYFWYCRKSQMKPPADVLATADGKKWTEPSKLNVFLGKLFPCLFSIQAPCEKWNRYIGEALSFDDLPLQAPDYYWCVKINLLHYCSWTIHEHTPKDDDEVYLFTGP